MVIRKNNGHWLLVTQPAHAWISGQIADNWGGNGFACPPPWKELCLAAARHDDGWTSRDIQPEWNPDTGLPYDFKDIPIDDHMSIWKQSVALVEPSSRFAALLVSRHVMSLFSMHDFTREPESSRMKAERFKSLQHAMQKRLIAELEEDSLYKPFMLDQNLKKHRQLISAFDYLSLFLILGESDETEVDDLPVEDGPSHEQGSQKIHLSRIGAHPEGHAAHHPEKDYPETDNPESWTVSPWPFAADFVQLRCDAIRLEKRCVHQQDLDRAMEQSTRVLFKANLIPGS